LRGLLTLAEKDANTPGHIRLCTVLDHLFTFLERDAEPDPPPAQAAQVKPQARGLMRRNK
jgi:hypothetical protein